MTQIYFFASIALSFAAWGVLVTLFVWPRLKDMPRSAALRPLLILHCFRFEGLSFLVPGIVSPELPSQFAHAAGYGDLIAAILALLALGSLTTRWASAAVWSFNVWGTLDLLDAFFQANRTGLAPGQLQATFWIPTLLVPLLFITHLLVYRLMLRRQAPSDLIPVRAAAQAQR